jgi:hypothetical protein
MNAWFRVKAAAASLALAAFLAPSVSFAQSPAIDCFHNLVKNGDFSEDGGSFTGWTYNEGFDNFYWSPTAYGTGFAASNGCTGAPCITPAGSEQDHLSQTIQTLPGLRYKLTFTYDAGAGGVNELKVLFGNVVAKDIVNAAQGSSTYTVTIRATKFQTVLDFLGRQDNAFSFLTDISVTPVL